MVGHRMELALCAALLVVAGAVLCTDGGEEYRREFEEFVRQYGRQYATEQEERERFGWFVQNMKRAAELERENPLAVFGVTLFSDWSEAEMRRLRGLRARKGRREDPDENVLRMGEEKVRAAGGKRIDWRERGAVTHVKNQGGCGDCWSFGTTGNIEGQWFLAGNALTSLSEQQLVSCDTYDGGCNGGNAVTPMGWLVNERQGQIAADSSYPYVSGDGYVPPCWGNLSSLTVGAIITGHSVLEQNEDTMAAFVFAHGPVAIGVDAGIWNQYKSGILTGCSPQNIDHEVLIVGFDDAYTPPYWVVKNSWTAGWGEHGYIRLEKGTNQCGIKYQPVTAHALKKRQYIKKTCSDSDCASCTEETMEQDMCTSNGVQSFVVVSCADGGMHVRTFANQACSGDATSAVLPTGKCLAASNGNVHEFVSYDCTKPHPVTPIPKVRQAFFVQKYFGDPGCKTATEQESTLLDFCMPVTNSQYGIFKCNGTYVNAYAYSDGNCSGTLIFNNAQPVFPKCTKLSWELYSHSYCT